MGAVAFDDQLFSSQPHPSIQGKGDNCELLQRSLARSPSLRPTAANYSSCAGSRMVRTAHVQLEHHNRSRGSLTSRFCPSVETATAAHCHPWPTCLRI